MGKKTLFNLDTMDGHVIRMVVPTPQSPRSPASTFQCVHTKPEILIIVIQNLWPPVLDMVILGYITVHWPLDVHYDL
jgi:hypothetical protein